MLVAIGVGCNDLPHLTTAPNSVASWILHLAHPLALTLPLLFGKGRVAKEEKIIRDPGPQGCGGTPARLRRSPHKVAEVES
jgi:hypothetical protein